MAKNKKIDRSAYTQKDENGELYNSTPYKIDGVIAGYSSLKETAIINGNDTGFYSLNIGLTPKQVKDLEKFVKKVYGAKTAKRSNIVYKAEDDFEDYQFIRAKSKTKVYIVDEDKQEVELNGYLKRGAEITVVVSVLPTLFNKDPYISFYIGGLQVNSDDLIRVGNSKAKSLLLGEEEEDEEDEEEEEPEPKKTKKKSKKKGKKKGKKLAVVF